MAYKKKTWSEKRQGQKHFPKFVPFKPSFPCGKALIKMGAGKGDNVVLAPPLAVDAIMKSVPSGRLITLAEICRALAKKYKADYCCTLTTGIFVMIAANAAEEMKREGKKNDNPYWRTLKVNGFLNEKYPGGQEAHKKLLAEEGFTITKRGKKYQVADFEKYLVRG